MQESIRFTLNGAPATVTVDGSRKLLWVLRTDLGLTGTKYGCGENYCGACTVLIDDQAVRSCQVTIKEVAGKDVVTIEGLARDGKLHAVQRAFMEHDAMQCGYCTPGMIMNVYSLLKKYPQPSSSQIVEEMEDSFCRCGAHNRIVRAVEAAARDMKGGY